MQSRCLPCQTAVVAYVRTANAPPEVSGGGAARLHHQGRDLPKSACLLCKIDMVEEEPDSQACVLRGMAEVLRESKRRAPLLGRRPAARGRLSFPPPPPRTPRALGPLSPVDPCRRPHSPTGDGSQRQGGDSACQRRSGSSISRTGTGEAPSVTDSPAAGVSTGWTLRPSPEKGRRPDGRELVGTRGPQVPEHKGSAQARGVRGLSGLRGGR